MGHTLALPRTVQMGACRYTSLASAKVLAGFTPDLNGICSRSKVDNRGEKIERAHTITGMADIVFDYIKSVITSMNNDLGFEAALIVGVLMSDDERITLDLADDRIFRSVSVFNFIGKVLAILLKGWLQGCVFMSGTPEGKGGRKGDEYYY